MDWSTVKFCPDVNGRIDAISQFVANKVFQSQSEDLKNILKVRYTQMEYGCRNELAYNHDKWNLRFGDVIYQNLSTARKKDVRLLMPNNCVNANGDLLSLLDNENVGHDLPVWLYKGDKCPLSTVMIIAQDPKRKEGQDNIIYNQAQRRGIILSSPWALCSKDFRENGSNNWIVSLVETLLSGGRMVYLTDNNKFYAREPNYVRRNFRELYDGFRDLVRDEIQRERPEFIITIGGDAIKTLMPSLEKKQDWRITDQCPYHEATYSLRWKDVCCDIPVYAFVHPSNINRGGRGDGFTYADLLRSRGLNPESYIVDAIRSIIKEKANETAST